MNERIAEIGLPQERCPLGVDLGEHVMIKL
jgi:hypothetical protein